MIITDIHNFLVKHFFFNNHKVKSEKFDDIIMFNLKIIFVAIMTNKFYKINSTNICIYYIYIIFDINRRTFSSSLKYTT